MTRIPKPWECIRFGRQIPGRSKDSKPEDLNPGGTDPFCSDGEGSCRWAYQDENGYDPRRK